MDSFNKYKTEEIEAIANDEENKKCFQCQSFPANWICVYNGIFLCASCAGEHRAFGNRISCIKSLILDKLNLFQIETMKMGGNTKAKTLLTANWKDFQAYEKIVVFSSKLMEYHRNVIYDTIVGNPIQPKIEANEVTEIMEKTTVVQRPILTEVPQKIEPKVVVEAEEEDDQLEVEPQGKGSDENEETQIKNDEDRTNEKEEEVNNEGKENQNDLNEDEELNAKAEEEQKQKKKEEDDKIVITKEVSEEPFARPEMQASEDSTSKTKYRVSEGKTKEKSDCALQ